MPAVELRSNKQWLPVIALVLCAIAVPIAGFWKNRLLLAEAKPNERVRAAALLVCESAAHGVFLLFQPAMRGRVDWRCRSYPQEAAVPGCASSLH